MFVRQINARLSRHASKIDENVLEYLNEAHLDLKSGLSIASLLSLCEICEDPQCVQNLPEPQIVRDCAILSQTLATGLAHLHTQYRTVQQDSFTMEQVLKKAISDLQAANEAGRLRERELLALANDLRDQLRTNNELYEKRISKAREHLTALGLFAPDCQEDSVDLSSESSFSQSREQSMTRSLLGSRENQSHHQRSYSGCDQGRTKPRSRAGPHVAKVISATQNKICAEGDPHNPQPWQRQPIRLSPEHISSSQSKLRDRSRHHK